MTTLTSGNCRARAGFTFIEILFAIVILGIGLVGLASMLAVASIQIGRTEHAVRSIASSRSGVETIRAEIAASPEHGFAQDAWADTRRLDGPIDAAHPLVRTLGERVERQRERAWLPFYLRPRVNGLLQPAAILCVGVRPVTETRWTSAQWDKFMGVSRDGTVAVDNDNAPIAVTIGPTVHVDNVGTLSIELLPQGSDDPAMVLQAAVENGLVFVTDPDPRVSGRMLRLSAPLTIAGQTYWTLANDSDLPRDPTQYNLLAGRSAYLIGRSLLSPSARWDAAANPFAGPSIAESFHVDHVLAR